MKRPPISLIIFVTLLGVLFQFAVHLMVGDQRDRPLSMVLLVIANLFPAAYGVIVGFRRGHEAASREQQAPPTSVH